MKNFILIAGLILGISNAKAELKLVRDNDTTPVHIHFGPYFYTLYVEVGAGPLHQGQMVKTYSGVGMTEAEGYLAGRQLCLNDGNSEKACDAAWVEERTPEKTDKIRKNW